jgi:hypothetical protein
VRQGTRPAVVGLGERIDRGVHAVGEQDRAAIRVEIEEGVPEPVRLTREPKGPIAVPLLKGLRRRRVVQIG